MKASVKVQGADRLLRKFREYPEQINRTLESVLRQEGRALCVEYGAATLPLGLSENNFIVAFRRKIDKDVRRVFASRDNPNWVGQFYAMIKATSPGKAKQFLWLANNRPEKVEAFLKKMKLPKGLNPAAHKAARTGKRGKVGKMPNGPVSVATGSQLGAFSRRQQALAGFAKAGWYCAAKGLGGRVRRNIREDSGKRRTEEIFPKYIRALARKYPDAGGARVSVSGDRVTVEIFTNVRHAREAMDLSRQLSAESAAQTRLAEALVISLRTVNKRTFSNAA